MSRGAWYEFFSPDVEINTKATPEERLLIAICDRALRDIMGVDGALKKEELRSARLYFLNHGSEEYGTFAHFCEHFGLCRKRILRKVIGDTGIALLGESRSKLWKERWGENKKAISRLKRR